MMKVLWLSNIVFPFPAKKIGQEKSCYGGWMTSLADTLSSNLNVQLAIASFYSGKKLLKYCDKNIIYYLIPGRLSIKKDNKMIPFFNQINDEFKPDITHIHGTEYAHGLTYLSSNYKSKIITSIQGIASSIYLHYLDGLNGLDVLKYITIRDIIKQDNLFQQRDKFYKQSLNEKVIIKRSDAVIGRTLYDYCYSLNFNPKIKYFHCYETLRSGFKNIDWNINKIERNTIFCTQASYPIKGFHILLKALYNLKQENESFKLFVGGNNIYNTTTLLSKLKQTGYSRYILSLIKKYNLEDDIIFLGNLSETKIIERLKKTHVFVLPSSVENSSTSLNEAMTMGLPCIATNSGGTPSMINDEVEGLLYNFNEDVVLSYNIKRIIHDDDLAIQLSKRAKKRSNLRNNSEDIASRTLNIYEELLGSGIDGKIN